MDNESTLEAILVNQNQKADETINALETIIAQNEENKIDTILEAQLLTQKELLEKLPEKQNISIQVEGVEVASIEGAKGDKGEQGEAGKTPVKGVDYFTDEDVQEITEKVQKLIKPAKDGKTPVKGVDYFTDKDVADFIKEVVPLFPKGKDGAKGKDGKDAKIDYDVIAEMVLEMIPKPKDGKDGSPDTPEQIKEKLLKAGLSFDDLKESSNIKNILDTIKNLSSKTVSLVELDDVDLSDLTKNEQGKYVLGGGGGDVESVNGQTGVVVLDTDDIADTVNKRYITDAQQTILNNTSGVNTGDNATNSQYSGLASSKENTITPGTIAQYWRGDKTFQTLDKTAVGLANVDNTSDANKPVSSATQTALNLKANLASPTFTGTVTVPATLTFTSNGSIVKAGNHAVTITSTATTNATLPSGTTTLASTSYVDTSSALRIPNTEKAAANGVATLNASTILNTSQTPEDDFILACQALGSDIKACSIGLTLNDIAIGVGTTSQTLALTAVYIKRSTTITGVRWFQTVQGVYTASDYNGVGLYSISGGNLNLVASSTNDGNIWKASVNTWQTKAFSSTYVAPAGIYYIAILYCSSAQTTAPTIGSNTTAASTAVYGSVFSNSHRLTALINTQTSLGASYNASASFTWTSNQRYLELY